MARNHTDSSYEMFPEHLMDSEISYELKLRGLNVSGNRRDRTRVLRKVLSQEESGETVVPIELPEGMVNESEMMICEGIQAHLRDEMRKGLRARSPSQVQHLVSRLVHLRDRFGRIVVKNEKELSLKKQGVAECHESLNVCSKALYDLSERAIETQGDSCFLNRSRAEKMMEMYSLLETPKTHLSAGVSQVNDDSQFQRARQSIREQGDLISFEEVTSEQSSVQSRESQSILTSHAVTNPFLNDDGVCVNRDEVMRSVECVSNEQESHVPRANNRFFSHDCEVNADHMNDYRFPHDRVHFNHDDVRQHHNRFGEKSENCFQKNVRNGSSSRVTFDDLSRFFQNVQNDVCGSTRVNHDQTVLPKSNFMLGSNWPSDLKFSGSSDSRDVKQFLRELEMFAKVNDLSDSQLCSCPYYFLTGSAKVWYTSRMSDLDTWKRFRAAILDRFYGQEQKNRLLEMIEGRRQGSHESFADYVDVMRFLFGQVDDDVLNNGSRLRILKRNMSQNLLKAGALLLLGNFDFEQFCQAMISLDKVQRSYNFLPTNTVRSFTGVSNTSVAPSVQAPRSSVRFGDDRRRTYDPNVRSFSCWNCGGPHPFVKCSVPLKEFCRLCGCQGVITRNCRRCQKN